MATVHRLPFELLRDIFLKVLAESRGTFLAEVYQNTERNCPYSWILVTHVCRAWRDVALASPTLWSTIIIINPAATKQFLQRARSGLLTVVCDTSVPLSSDDMTSRLDVLEWLLAEEIDRVEVLVMPGIARHLTKDFASKARHLRSLTLGRTFHEETGEPWTSSVLPFPAVEHLSIRAALPSFANVFGSTLKTLVILPGWGGHGPQTPDGFIFRPNTKGLLRSLRHMHRLEKLHAEIADEIVNTDIVARLPNLKEFWLIGPTAPAAYILLHLRIPRNIVFCFHRRFAHDHGPVSHVSEVLAQSMLDPVHWSGIRFFAFDPLLSVSISWEQNSGHYVIIGWRSLESRESRRKHLPDVKVELNVCERFPVLQTFLHLLHLADVQEVHLGPFKGIQRISAAGNESEVMMLANVLASRPSIQSLTLNGFDCEYVLQVLERTSATNITLKRVKFKPAKQPWRK